MKTIITSKIGHVCSGNDNDVSDDKYGQADKRNNYDVNDYSEDVNCHVDNGNDNDVSDDEYVHADYRKCNDVTTTKRLSTAASTTTTIIAHDNVLTKKAIMQATSYTLIVGSATVT